jgi:hypothetical protein
MYFVLFSLNTPTSRPTAEETFNYSFDSPSRSWLSLVAFSSLHFADELKCPRAESNEEISWKRGRIRLRCNL